MPKRYRVRERAEFIHSMLKDLNGRKIGNDTTNFKISKLPKHTTKLNDLFLFAIYFLLDPKMFDSFYFS